MFVLWGYSAFFHIYNNLTPKRGKLVDVPSKLIRLVKEIVYFKKSILEFKKNINNYNFKSST